MKRAFGLVNDKKKLTSDFSVVIKNIQSQIKNQKSAILYSLKKSLVLRLYIRHEILTIHTSNIL